MLQCTMTISRVPVSGYADLSPDERIHRAEAFEEAMRSRRTIRDFAPTPVPREVIEAAIRAASRAPSGANMQPWTFVAISDPATKRRIREAAEEEERAFYGGRASGEWLEALRPFDTNEHKPYLETAPWLIAVFSQTSSRYDDGSPRKHYYVKESVGIATGFLLAALHHAGLATLTHTPSPMNFLRDVLDRPKEEQAFVLLVVGLPAGDATVPALERKAFEAIARFIEPAAPSGGS
jgi:iodotyrosine deiodinase